MDATRKLLVCMEECGELTQACSKIIRFGMNKEKYDHLVEELGDLTCMIGILQEQYGISDAEIVGQISIKLDKLKLYEGYNE